MELFDFLEEWIRDLALVASGAAGSALNPDGHRFLQELVQRWTIRPVQVAEAMAAVSEARSLAAGNVNPQLVTYGLLWDLRGALTGAPRPPGRGE
jgi:hypothetical protein